jgi:hypothetical protein
LSTRSAGLLCPDRPLQRGVRHLPPRGISKVRARHRGHRSSVGRERRRAPPRTSRTSSSAPSRRRSKRPIASARAHR